MPAPTLPNKIDPSTTVNQDISPDGVPVQTTAAPVKSKETSTVQPIEEKAKEVDLTDDGKVVEKEVVAPEDDKDLFNKFLEASSTDKPRVEEPKAKEEKKDEVKPAEKLSTTPTIPGQKPARDYTDLEPEVVPLFKNMSNEAFDKLKPIYLEHRKVKAELDTTKKTLEEVQKGQVKIPDSYYEHENAFILTPEFSQTAKQVQDASAIYQHWVAQLQKVREGAKEFDFLDYDPKSGQYVVTQKIPSDIQSETQLMTWINYASQQRMNAEAKMNAIAQTYKGKHSESVQTLAQMRQKYFDAFSKQENKPIYDPIIKGHLESLPSVFRNSPIAQVLAESLTMNTVLAKMIQQLQENKGNGGEGNGNGQVQKAKVTAKRSGPTAEEAAGEGDGGTAGKGEVTTDDFERVKQGL